MKLFLSLKQNTTIPFWLISLSIVFGLTLPWLIQDAMFQDAILYSCVSHNMGIGIGTFWFPQYSTLNIEGMASFHEQLPLVFGIQALFYKLFGDSLYIERFYTFLMLVLNILLINKLWKNVFKNKPDYATLGWLPVFLWIIIPLSFWSYRYNMLENTVSVFALASVILSYKAINKPDNIRLWILSGLFVFFASFSKGIPGLFPLAFPLLYWLTTKKTDFKKSIFYTLILAIIPTIIYLTFITFPDSRESLSIYFFERLLGRTNTMPTADYRLEIIVRLFKELIPVILFAAITFCFVKRRKIKEVLSENFRLFLLFLGLGIAGTFPLALTMVQKGFYMVPALPYFAIAFAILIAPIISNTIEKINIKNIKYKIFTAISIFMILMVFAYTFSKKNKIERQEDIITDVYEIGKVVPKFSTITVPENMYDQYNFELQGYLVRYFNISINPYKEYDYFLKENDLDNEIPKNYKKIDLPLIKYELYKKSQ